MLENYKKKLQLYAIKHPHAFLPTGVTKKTSINKIKCIRFQLEWIKKKHRENVLK